MSLASHVTNLFSSGSPGTGPEDGNGISLANDGLSKGHGSMEDGISRSLPSRSETMPPQMIEEEGRPPYLHVRFNIFHA